MSSWRPSCAAPAGHGSSWMRWRAALAVVVLLLGIAPALSAQSADETRMQELERQIEALRAEIAALKQAQEAAPQATQEGTPAEAGDRVAEIERRLEVLAGEIERLRVGEAAAEATESQYGLGPAASKVYRTDRGLSIGGYGELLYEAFDSRRDDGAESGRVDQTDLLRGVLYFGYKWNDRWLLNTEIEYEHASTGEGGEVSMEFAYVDFLWRPEVGLRGGLLLVPMGFVNELHEPTVFLGAKRSAVETSIIPTTWRENGLGVFGDAGPLTYRSYIVNGLDASGFAAGGLRGGRQKGARAKSEDFAWVGRLDWTPAPGLLLGGSAYAGDSGQDIEVTPGGEQLGVATTLFEGHFEWRWQGLQFRALAAQAELDDVAELNAARGLTGANSIGEKLEGAYLELGYDLFARRGGESALIPYGRWEAIDTQAEVPAGFRANPANDQEILTLGFAYKPIEQLILKADYQDIDNEAGTGIDQINVLLGYIF